MDVISYVLYNYRWQGLNYDRLYNPYKIKERMV